MRPASLVRGTDIETLPIDRVVTRRSGYTVVQSPSNPRHWWGNLLLFDDAPGEGDAKRWEALFEREFRHEPCIVHRTFAWDRDGVVGRAREEFLPRGYGLDESIGLAAAPADVRPHPRANAEVVVRALDPDGDERLWREVIAVQAAARDEGLDEDEYREFATARLETRRELFRAGRGAWYVALDPENGAVAASCGIVVTAGRGRYQAVDTAERYRRRGIASRLLVDAAGDAARAHDAHRLVIVADADYHALALYESLGFRRVERAFGVCRPEMTSRSPEA
jgi:ribosomal protein S18 acetylase RimI-like enzyme